MSDEEILDGFLRDATPTIEELVNRALQQGHPLHHVAILLERGFDGQVRGGCGSRKEIGARLVTDARLSPEQRNVLRDALNSAGNQVPAVLLVQGEGVLVVGVRRLGGSLNALS